jgi:hypothetical protein
MKKKNNTFKKPPKFNRKIVETEAKSIAKTHLPVMAQTLHIQSYGGPNLLS